MVNVKQIMESAKAALVKGEREAAADFLNKGIGLLGNLTQKGVEKVDGASIDRWKERFWFQLEDNQLLE
jgi:hypothetical protein